MPETRSTTLAHLPAGTYATSARASRQGLSCKGCRFPASDDYVYYELGRWHHEPSLGILPPMKTYTAIVERDPDTGLYVGYVPGFPGAHSQAKTLDELNANLKEVIALLLEDGEPQLEAEFVGIQTVVV